MDFGIPNNYTGQFFTPWEIAALNAEIGLPNIEEQLIDRIKAASKNKPELVIAGIEGALSAALGQKDNYFINKFLPMVAPLIEPIKIYDPCCGSGTMLLAAASKIPTWAHQFNLVGFYGQDLDITCVMMAKINMMIYGLNGFGLALEINAHMGKITKNEEGGFSTTISEPFGKDMIQLPLKVFANSET
jgi:type I restriction-modification system DNA methylase subunit